MSVLRLPIEQAAKRLGVAPNTIRRGLKNGRFDAIRDNSGRWLIAVPDQPLGNPGQVTQGYPESALVNELRARIVSLEADKTRLMDMLAGELAGRDRQLEDLRNQIATLSRRRRWWQRRAV